MHTSYGWILRTALEHGDNPRTELYIDIFFLIAQYRLTDFYKLKTLVIYKTAP